MNIAEIKEAVDKGKKVQWIVPIYQVVKDSKGQYMIHCTPNDHYIGLTNLAGDKLNGKESDFTIIQG